MAIAFGRFARPEQRNSLNWPCYHTEFDCFPIGGQDVGIISRVDGSSFAVLAAEELFASG
jgi:hypothetical protein